MGQAKSRLEGYEEIGEKPDVPARRRYGEAFPSCPPCHQEGGEKGQSPAFSSSSYQTR
jgi:hypothetical protein